MSLDVARGGVELSPICQNARPWHEVQFQPDAVWVLEQHVVVARSPCAFHRPPNDGGVHFLEQSSTPIHVLARTGAKTEVVQADTLLDEAFAGQRRSARFGRVLRQNDVKRNADDFPETPLMLCDDCSAPAKYSD